MVQIIQRAGRIPEGIPHCLVQSLFIQRFSPRNPLVEAHSPDQHRISPARYPVGNKIGETVTQLHREHLPDEGNQPDAVRLLMKL
jgi:hypothetical protein